MKFLLRFYVNELGVPGPCLATGIYKPYIGFILSLTVDPFSKEEKRLLGVQITPGSLKRQAPVKMPFIFGEPRLAPRSHVSFHTLLFSSSLFAFSLINLMPHAIDPG